MTTSYPTALDDTSVLENDKTDDSLRAGNLADFQNNAADALLAIEKTHWNPYSAGRTGRSR